MAPTVLSASNASSDGSGSRYQGNAVRVPERRSGFAPQFFDLRADDSVQDHLNSPSATPDIYDVDWQNTHSPHALPSEAAEDNDLGQGFPSSSEGLGTTTVEDDESGTNALLSNISMLTTDTVSMEALLASPRIFSCMTKLTVISYEGLQLQGRDLASLGCIPSLRQLKLRKCGIKNLDFLVSFVGRSPVEEVDVAANDISSLPPRSSFARATLPRCFGQLTDWSHMAEQKMEKFPSSLRTLDLSYNRITDMRSLEALAEFPNLHVVRLNGNDMSKCLETDASLARNLAEWPRCRSRSRLSHAGDDGCLTSEVVSPTDKTNRHRSTELQTALQKIVCENETLYEQLQAARLALAAGQETSASGAERSPRASGAAGAVIKRDTQREHHARTWAIPRLLPATRSLQGLALAGRLVFDELRGSARCKVPPRRSHSAGNLDAGHWDFFDDFPQDSRSRATETTAAASKRVSDGASPRSGWLRGSRQRSLSDGIIRLPSTSGIGQLYPRAATLRSATEHRQIRKTAFFRCSDVPGRLDEAQQKADARRRDVPAILHTHHIAADTQASLRCQRRAWCLAAFERDVEASARLVRCTEHLCRLDRARRAFINGLYRVGEADEASSLYYWTAAAMTQLENMRLILPPVHIPGATPETNRVLQAAQDYSPGGLAARAGCVSEALKKQVIDMETKALRLLLCFENDVRNGGGSAQACRRQASSTRSRSLPAQAPLEALSTKLTLLRLHYLEKLLIRRFLEEAHQYLRSAAALADAQRRLHAIDAEISSVVSAVKYFGTLPLEACTSRARPIPVDSDRHPQTRVASLRMASKSRIKDTSPQNGLRHPDGATSETQSEFCRHQSVPRLASCRAGDSERLGIRRSNSTSKACQSSAMRRTLSYSGGAPSPRHSPGSVSEQKIGKSAFKPNRSKSLAR